MSALASTPVVIDQRCAAELLLRCILDGRATDGALVELRRLRGQSVEQEWFSSARAAVEHALRFVHGWDVYVGCLPRYQHGGGREALRDGARFVWADCDSSAAVWALRRFAVRPSFAVYSGSYSNAPHVHAWWLLRQPVTLEVVEWINRRLVLALGSDARVHDAPRVLRLPATLNHKTSPPTLVECSYVGEDVDVHELVDALPALTVPQRPRRASSPLRIASALDTIAPAEYVERLTGRVANASGKVQCPFHAGGDERTPSLHCYPDPADGWTCFGSCPAPPGRAYLGGDVYTFAGLLWGLNPRSKEMVELRLRLEDTFAISTLGAIA